MGYVEMMRLITAMRALTAGFRLLADMIPAAQQLKIHADMVDQHLAAVEETVKPAPPKKGEAAEDDPPKKK